MQRRRVAPHPPRELRLGQRQVVEAEREQQRDLRLRRRRRGAQRRALGDRAAPRARLPSRAQRQSAVVAVVVVGGGQREARGGAGGVARAAPSRARSSRATAAGSRSAGSCAAPVSKSRTRLGHVAAAGRPTSRPSTRRARRTGPPGTAAPSAPKTAAAPASSSSQHVATWPARSAPLRCTGCSGTRSASVAHRLHVVVHLARARAPPAPGAGAPRPDAVPRRPAGAGDRRRPGTASAARRRRRRAPRRASRASPSRESTTRP